MGLLVATAVYPISLKKTAKKTGGKVTDTSKKVVKKTVETGKEVTEATKKATEQAIKATQELLAKGPELAADIANTKKLKEQAEKALFGARNELKKSRKAYMRAKKFLKRFGRLGEIESIDGMFSGNAVKKGRLARITVTMRNGTQATVTVTSKHVSAIAKKIAKKMLKVVKI